MSSDDARDAKGRWRPGHSGHSGGSRSAKALREALASNAADVVNAVLLAAIEGDMAAARIVLERLVPPLRASTEPLELPELAEGDLVMKTTAIVNAMANGRISADQGEQLLRALASAAAITELAALKERLAALESREIL